MAIKKITESNRIAWNEAIPKHQSVLKEEWDQAFRKKGYVVFSDIELQLFDMLGVKDKSIAQMCCNNGIELLSLKNLGAAKCVGFDISELAIEEAQKRADETNINCTFIACDIYDIPSEFNHSFDIVYLSLGVLGWLPDLNLFYTKIAELLSSEGYVFIYEKHPISELVDQVDLNNFSVPKSYFDKGPYIGNEGIDYIGKTTYEGSTYYWFNYTLSDVISGLVQNDFRIKFFKEYDLKIRKDFNLSDKSLLPESYVLIGQLERREV